VDFAAAVAEICNLEAEYARAWDAADAAGWAAVFTEDGVFEVGSVGGRPGERFQGRPALQAVCARHNEKYEGLHLMHVPHVVVHGDDATGRLHFEWSASTRPGITPSVRRRTIGYYEVTYRFEAAQWLMAHRLEKQVSETTTRYFGV
jgi:uncharacterized protein (TIGR02246 family)